MEPHRETNDWKSLEEIREYRLCTVCAVINLQLIYPFIFNGIVDVISNGLTFKFV